MTIQNVSGAWNLQPELMGLPETGFQTVTFWASRYGLSRKTFVAKLKTLGVVPDDVLDTVRAEELYAAIERHRHEQQRKTTTRPG